MSISVFDIDDTLLVTSAYNYIQSKKNTKICAITSNEFTNLEKWEKQYNMPSGFIKQHINNYDEFRNLKMLKQGCIIKPIFEKLRQIYEKGGTIGILTARQISSKKISSFFKSHFKINIPPSHIICNNDIFYRKLKPHKIPIDLGSIEGRKQAGILWFIMEKKYSNITFYDDSPLNIKSVKTLQKVLDTFYPNNTINIHTRQITKSEQKSCNTKIKGILSKKHSDIGLSTMKCKKGLKRLLLQ